MAERAVADALAEGLRRHGVTTVFGQSLPSALFLATPRVGIRQIGYRTDAFGLRIAHDTYSTELTSDTSEVRGGDGGESVCGGYGHLLAWLPLATAHTHPDTAEFVYGEDGDGLYEDFTVRPVLTLRRA